jgi:integrase
MPGYIEDRWMTKTVDPATGKKRRKSTYGVGLRYRVCGIPGVKDASFKGLEDARAWLKTSATDAGRGTFIDPRHGAITLRAYVEEHWWPSTRYPPSTKESVKSRVWGHILPHLGGLPLAAITTDSVNAWAVRAERDLDPSTVRVCWQHVSTILQAAKEAKRISVNPARGHSTARPPVVPKTKARRWDQGRVLAVRAALPARYQVLPDLGVGAGLRQGEALGFSPADLSGNELFVQRQVMRINSRLCFGPPKGNKERTVRVPDVLIEAVESYALDFETVKVTLPWVDPLRPSMRWEDRPLVTVPLLVTTDRKHAVNRSTWNTAVWKPALGAAGVIEQLPEPEGMTDLQRRRWLSDGKNTPTRWPESREDGFHVTRHTFASVQLQAGESIVTLAAWLGHSDPAFTLRTYTHFMPEAGARGVAAMDRWLRGLDPE